MEQVRNGNQVKLEEDERLDRTEFLPDNMKPNDWIRYQQKQLHFATIRLGGDWRK